MSNQKIEPEKITKPIQLIAVWFIGLVILVGAFIGGAVAIQNSPVLQTILVIASVITPLVFVGAIFLLQTKFRTQFLDDTLYADYLKRQEKLFKNFKPENEAQPALKVDESKKEIQSWEGRETKRKQRYAENHGLFLIHNWWPSRSPKQVADISITISQHGEGPLTNGRIKSVEYHLGPKFFKQTVTKTNANDNFELNVSAYGPMLCLATVNFDDGTPPLELERYINF
ncbi:MAG: hypothetical protein L6461_08045 [Anaerolineae bacterium]|nr:hypothetical protein [Anaerolineae bacterium]